VTQFESQLLEGRCKAEQVEHYLETLAQQAREKGIKGVVVLDNAGFHKAKRIKQQLDRWQSMGLTLWFQPPYSPPSIALNSLEKTQAFPLTSSVLCTYKLKCRDGK
jgi:transposase